MNQKTKKMTALLAAGIATFGLGGLTMLQPTTARADGDDYTNARHFDRDDRNRDRDRDRDARQDRRYDSRFDRDDYWRFHRYDQDDRRFDRDHDYDRDRR
jgi:hypothetical protein